MKIWTRSLLSIGIILVSCQWSFAGMSSTIIAQGHCGFTKANSFFYLVNTDSTASLRVTVRTTWRSGIQSGQTDRVYILPAGGQQTLGCGDSGVIPVTYYQFQVVGEERIHHRR